jgi:hypothetical protein
LINPEFIRRLQEQRALHKREAAFHLAEVDKHGAAEEALESMIQAAEKIVAILSPAPTKADDAPDEPTAEDVSDRPSWTAATTPAARPATAPPTHDELPTRHGQEDLMSDGRAGNSGNLWRARLLRSHS